MICEKIEEIVLKAVKNAFSEKSDFSVSIETPREKNHGDYSTGVALKIAKQTKENPTETAEKIVFELKKAINEEENFIDKIEIVNPGFINFFLSEEFVKKEALKVLQEKEKYGSEKKKKEKTAVIDYSSPNIAKAFGIGHLRSTIIGQAIYNIYKFRGWKCIGDNHLGDWGTQFGKLIYQIKEKKLENKSSEEKEKILQELTTADLEKLYVDFHKEAEKNDELDGKGRAWFKKLEAGDEEAKQIWDACVKTSKDEFNRIYRLLGIEIDYSFGESFYLNLVPEVIDELKNKKIAKKNENALVVDFSEEMPSLLAMKSDGATTYLARDLAAIKYRIEKWSPDLFIYEVGSDQSLYFRQLFKTVNLLGWKDEKSFVHIAHGLVRWKHGKFSTRRGDTIHLEEILKEAVERAAKIIRESEAVKEISQEEREKIAQTVGIGAVKYNDLAQHHRKDIVFDWEKVLNLKGDSGPYIQYTFARCHSVLEKSGFNTDEVGFSSSLNEEEKKVLKMAVKFPETVKAAEESFSPNLVCHFLFDLAQKFNLFYNNNRILEQDENTKKTRLTLTAVTAQVLENGLRLLGIGAPKKM